MISVCRKKARVSQKQLAGELNVSQQCVAKWESGKSNPRAELLPKIAKVLNCTIDELLRPESEEKGKTCCQCKYFCVGVAGEGCECGLGFGEVYHTMMACPSFKVD